MLFFEGIYVYIFSPSDVNLNNSGKSFKETWSYLLRFFCAIRETALCSVTLGCDVFKLFMNLVYSSKCNTVALLVRGNNTVGWGGMMLECRDRCGLPFDWTDLAEIKETQWWPWHTVSVNSHYIPSYCSMRRHLLYLQKLYCSCLIKYKFLMQYIQSYQNSLSADLHDCTICQLNILAKLPSKFSLLNVFII